VSTLSCRLILVGLVLAPGSAVLAQGPAKMVAADELDHKIRSNMNKVITLGAAMYNAGDQQGTYQFFRGALTAVGPVLGHRPALAKSVSEGLRKAALLPTPGQRAFALRAVLDEMLKTLPKGPGQEVVKPTPKPAAKSLYEQLGGAKGVDALVTDYLARVEKDPRVNFTRKGTPDEWKPTPENKAKLKKHMIEFVSTVTGGPKTYTGPDMKAAHKGMKISEAEFAASVEDLKTTLDKVKAPPAAKDKLLQMVEATRKDIVAKPGETPKPKDAGKPKDTPKPKDKDGKGT
jgi:hemoglobin